MQGRKKRGKKNAKNLAQKLVQKRKQIFDKFFEDLAQLKKLINIWRKDQVETKMDSPQKAILIQYSIYLEQLHNMDQLKGPTSVKVINNRQVIKDIKSQKKLFIGAKLLQDRGLRINFSKKFVQKMKPLSQQTIKTIFLNLRLMEVGFIKFKKEQSNQLLLKEYQRANKLAMKYYTIQVNNSADSILCSFRLNQLPQYSFNGGTLQSFINKYIFTCEDIINHDLLSNQKKMNQIFNSIERIYQEDPRINLVEEKHTNQQIENYIRNASNPAFTCSLTKALVRTKKNETNLQIQNFLFLLKKYLSNRIRLQYLQFIASNNCKQITQRQHQFYQQPEEQNSFYQLQRLSKKNQIIQFKGHYELIQKIQKIPNLNLLLTQQQRQVLCKNGNLIIVGRSGTGKTTCALLRLYYIQVSIKSYQYERIVRNNKSELGCLMAMFDRIQVSKNVFLTFSNILIQQIKQQYSNIISQIREKHSLKCQICSSIKKQKEKQDNEDPIDRIKRLQADLQRKIVGLETIEEKDFPCFFTIENFLRVIDKTIIRPFFCQQKQLIKQRMVQIKQSIINRYQYNSKSIELVQAYKAVYVDYDFFLHHIWERLPKELTKFSKQFCLLTPSIVWSEIFSILKGSVQSYLSPQGFISLKMYMQKSHSLFQMEQKANQYKQKTYKILRSYSEWLFHKKAYDLMDVVNHNLRQIQFYGYQGPKINYMFIDQVQDLTQSAILLISKMVINNVFYCGDTAQAITKGVSFKFDQLKLLFNKKHFKQALNLQPPQGILNLTVNFRSHNSILQIANFIVSSIQILFPSSVNCLKKQRSDLIGPKPFIILNEDYLMIFQLGDRSGIGVMEATKQAREFVSVVKTFSPEAKKHQLQAVEHDVEYMLQTGELQAEQLKEQVMALRGGEISDWNFVEG